jgi:signal transduction histidine kinase/CheY-like chemotaxis protein
VTHAIGHELAHGAPAPELDAAERRSALAPIRRRADRLIAGFVVVHFAFAFLFANAYDTWAITNVVAPLAAALFFGTRWLAPHTFVARAAAGVALQVFCALHIFQYHGLAEQHFWFFTSTTAMIAYQDPRALWPGVVLIILQHVLFAVLHNSGVDLRFFEGTQVGFEKLVFHFGIALVQTFLCVALARELRRRTLEGAALTKAYEAAHREALQAARSRGVFLANMSHEIRSPMNGIEGMADLLLRSELDHEQRECAETIRSSSHALLSVIGDVLDLSKIESGKFTLVPEPFDVRRLAVDVARLLQPRAAANDDELDVEIEPDVPRLHVGDADRVRQVLVNLVGNAVKFTRGGRVTVRVAAQRADDGRHEVVLVVADTGIGIAESDRARVFEPFEQADGSTTRRYGGTGLGLAISRRLVELMGGTIELTSEVGVGSTFTVTLPLAVHTDAPASPLAPRQPLVGLVVRTGGRDAAEERRLARVLADAGASVLAPGEPGRAGVAVVALPANGVNGANGARGPRLVVEACSASESASAVVAGQAVERRVELARPFLPEHVVEAVARAAGRTAPPTEASAAAPTATRLHVLVVEDQDVNVRVVTRMLGKLGHTFEVARDGAQALAMLAHGSFAVVLMDCHMPVLSGDEATARWRERERAEGRQRTPIVALTANALVSDRERSLAVGMDGWLTKPLSLAALEAALRRHSTPARGAA